MKKIENINSIIRIAVSNNGGMLIKKAVLNSSGALPGYYEIHDGIWKGIGDLNELVHLLRPSTFDT